MTPLYVLGLFAAVWLSVAPSLFALRSEAHLVVFLADGTGPEARRHIEEILGRREVKTSRYVSPEEAASRLAGLMGRAGGAIPELPPSSLPGSYEVVLSSRATRAPETILRDLRAAPGVAEVTEQLELARRLSTVLFLATALGAFLGLILAVAAHVTVGNVVRLVFQGRREEVDILKVVGATDGFIRAPFLHEGSLMGTAGGLAAALLLVATKLALVIVGRSSSGLLADVLPQLATPIFLLLGLVVLGGLLGLWSAERALRGLLRPNES